MEVAGSNVRGLKDGANKWAQFNSPWGIVIHPYNYSLYICDYNNHCIRVVNKQGLFFEVNVNLCSVDPGVDTADFCDALGLSAKFEGPIQLIYSKRENSFLISDHLNNLIRTVSMDGT